MDKRIEHWDDERGAGNGIIVTLHRADYCTTQDPTFKRDRFLADCGVS